MFHETSCIITPDIFSPGNEAVVLLVFLEDQCVLRIVLERIFVFDIGYQQCV